MNEDRLRQLASAILDGQHINWENASVSVSDSDRRRIEQFRIVADIAGVDRLQSDAAIREWGPLRLLEPIGAGSFGEVFRAFDPALARDVALKILSAPSRPAEGRLLARVRHPNVVTVYGAAEHDGRCGIWMELIVGTTLADVVAQRGALDPLEVRQIGIALCAALGAVHGAGLLHGDIKAQNVMRDTAGRVVLTDFGTAAMGSRSEGLSGKTPLYAAPEVLDGAPLNIRAETYAVGVLLFYLATGQFPVAGATLDELRAAHSARRQTRVRDARPDVPRRLAAVIERAISPDPDRRFQDASSLETALKSKAGPHRRSWIAAASLAILLLAVVLAGRRAASSSTEVLPQSTFQSRDWILITAFENLTGDRRLDGSVESALGYVLNDSAYVNVASRDRVDDALRLMRRPAGSTVTEAVGREVALRDGEIKLLLAGSVVPARDGFAIETRLVNPADGRTVAHVEETTNGTDVPAAVRRLSLRLRAVLGESASSLQVSAERLQKVTTPSLPALRAFSDAFAAAVRENWGQADASLQSALAEDPTFATAEIFKAWTDSNLARPREVWLEEARRAVDLSGTVTERERYFIRGSFYKMSGDVDRAIGQFEALVERYPDDFWGLSNLASLYDDAGRQDDALDVVVRVARERPNDFYAAARAAQSLLFRRGLDAAREYVAHAHALLDAGGPQLTFPSSDRTWVLLFPAHEFWLQRRVKEAAAVVDSVERWEQIERDGVWADANVASMRLSLGQPRAAERAAERIGGSIGAMFLGEIALARGDTRHVTDVVMPRDQWDFAAVSLLVRAGDLDSAGRLLARIRQTGITAPQHEKWTADEIAEARGDAAAIERERLADLPWTRVMNGMRAFMYSETLARALWARGNPDAAIRVLEKTDALRDAVYSPASHNGYAWMRNQLLLADIYRQVGRAEDARVVERDLLQALAAADPDYPMLVDLKQRAARDR